MYRNQIEKLIEWKENKNKKPLIIRGARQVGKTWLMKEFGEKYYKNFAYINFDRNTRMEQLYSGDMNIERIIQGLKLESGINITANDTLIIFDEVQEVPNVLMFLKDLLEKATEYNIVAGESVLRNCDA